MTDHDGRDFLAWPKTGHWRRGIGIVTALLFGTYFVTGVVRDSTQAMIVFGVLTLGSVIGIVEGTKQLTAHRSRR